MFLIDPRPRGIRGNGESVEAFRERRVLLRVTRGEVIVCHLGCDINGHRARVARPVVEMLALLRLLRPFLLPLRLSRFPPRLQGLFLCLPVRLEMLLHVVFPCKGLAAVGTVDVLLASMLLRVPRRVTGGCERLLTIEVRGILAGKPLYGVLYRSRGSRWGRDCLFGIRTGLGSRAWRFFFFFFVVVFTTGLMRMPV